MKFKEANSIRCLSQFAACFGTPAHRPPQGRTTPIFKVQLQQGFAAGEMGFNDEFALQKS